MVQYENEQFVNMNKLLKNIIPVNVRSRKMNVELDLLRNSLVVS
jgi:hypothetical protein